MRRDAPRRRRRTGDSERQRDVKVDGKILDVERQRLGAVELRARERIEHVVVDDVEKRQHETIVEGDVERDDGRDDDERRLDAPAQRAHDAVARDDVQRRRQHGGGGKRPAEDRARKDDADRGARPIAVPKGDREHEAAHREARRQVGWRGRGSADDDEAAAAVVAKRTGARNEHARAEEQKKRQSLGSGGAKLTLGGNAQLRLAERRRAAERRAQQVKARQLSNKR